MRVVGSTRLLLLASICGGCVNPSNKPVDATAALEDGSAVVGGNDASPNAQVDAPSDSPASSGQGSDGATAADAPPGGGVDGAGPTIKVFDSVRINSKMEEGNFQKVTSAFDVGAGPFEKVTLTVDLDSACYPFDRWKDDPPPAGQNWPTKCDAFDRLFEIALDPPQKAGDPPAIELIRAITPFGGPLHLETDITDVINGLKGPHRLLAYIDTWSDSAGGSTGSDAGWSVSASVTSQPGSAPRQVLAVVPLIDDFVTTTTGGPLHFTLPAGTAKTMIEYRATGHTQMAGPMTGDCSGPPEEFCRREHTVSLDGQDVGNFVAWRTDCASLCTLTTQPPAPNPMFMYCKQNPTGSPDSVRASRANWCPGSMTPPQPFESTAAAGPHDFGFNVATIDSGGKWRISAVVFAYGP